MPVSKINTLTRDDIGLIQAELTALQNLIRPARLPPVHELRHPVILIPLIVALRTVLLRILEFGGDDLEVMMMGLVDVARDVDVAIERTSRFEESLGSVLKSRADEVLRKRRAEAEVVDDVRDVRHVSREVVTLRLGLYVKVTGRPIDE